MLFDYSNLLNLALDADSLFMFQFICLMLVFERNTFSLFQQPFLLFIFCLFIFLWLFNLFLWLFILSLRQLILFLLQLILLINFLLILLRFSLVIHKLQNNIKSKYKSNIYLLSMFKRLFPKIVAARNRRIRLLNPD